VDHGYVLQCLVHILYVVVVHSKRRQIAPPSSECVLRLVAHKVFVLFPKCSSQVLI
jgi:hypothetical protein